jgi:hypothetical protein
LYSQTGSSNSEIFPICSAFLMFSFEAINLKHAVLRVVVGAI